MPLPPLTLLRELIALPSVNPMGGVGDPETCGEWRVTAYLASLFDRLGLPWEKQTVEPGRENIVARLEGGVDRLLLWEVHQDTVPVAGMTVDPFGAEVRDGRVYGRGACDVKGGMAAMLAAVSQLIEAGPTRLPTIALACTVNEECGFSGATSLARLWGDGGPGLLGRRPDAALIAEPTGLDVVVAHKGIVRWRCHTRGRAAHTSRPEAGENAIYAMGRVVSAVDRYQREVTPALAAHRLCGGPTACVSTIRGGLSVNTVPDRCTVDIDRRLVPDEDPHAARKALIDWLREETGLDLEHEPPYSAARGLSDEVNGPLAAQLAATARACGAPGRQVGVGFGTDAAVIARAGVPAVVFGPGSIDQAHTADESIEIAQLERAVEILTRFARDFAS